MIGNRQGTRWTVVLSILVDDWGFRPTVLCWSTTIDPASNLSWMDWQEQLNVISEATGVSLPESFPRMLTAQDRLNFWTPLGDHTKIATIVGGGFRLDCCGSNRMVRSGLSTTGDFAANGHLAEEVSPAKG